MSNKEEFKEFRGSLVDAMRRELIGPDLTDAVEIQTEELEVSPLQVYGAGILFPQKLPHENLEDVADENDLKSSSDTSGEHIEDELDELTEKSGGKSRKGSMAGEDAGFDEQPLNLANEYSPSAMGITFRVMGKQPIKAKVTFGKYIRTKVKEPHPKAGEVRMDGEPYPLERESNLYKRVPKSDDHSIETVFESGPDQVFDIAETEGGLKLHATLRSVEDDGAVISLMLVNHNQSQDSGSVNAEDAFFQAKIVVTDVEERPVFSNIDRPSGNSEEMDMASMELLYRHRKSFCLGHGCAADWSKGDDVESTGTTDAVWTSTIPTYEVQPVEPREKPYGTGQFNLSMRFLASGEGLDANSRQTSIVNALTGLCDDYESWITDTETEASTLSGRLSEAAKRHLNACRQCLGRMKEGVSILGNNVEAMTSFRLANRAMLMQQIHTGLNAERKLDSEYPVFPEDYDEGEANVRRWRPFQLAFILMNLAGTIDPLHEDRELVDLIWFPTGGGKTEAYLGLAAYMICLRRLRNPANAGTTVLMRYTLRLLTAQQFQRASSLILSLDVLRQERYLNVDLGEEPISIGLWVGNTLSPNKRADAVSSLNKMNRDAYASNPFQVLECPWCKCEMNNRDNYGYVTEKAPQGNSKTVFFRCPDSSCRWSGNIRMPVIVIDDDIYETPPTLILGTVDKFAQVAWEERTGRLFGIEMEHDPPELIIQDELHLISGPLGTIVGLYETAIERFCSRDGVTPKIVASTATIKRAQEQCWALYHRKSYEFPAQGLRAGDSYFAFENDEAPGRLYTGVFASGLKSQATAQVRTCSALLQAAVPKPADVMSPEDIESLDSDQQPELPVGTYLPLADPYGTLVWYFNSLRELGHATTMCTGDIPEYLKSMCRRGDIPWDYRRRIRDYVELTSRRTADEIPNILKQLSRPWMPKPEFEQMPVDILLATNMISVGVDVSRLGLMLVTGQPKSTSEYIQATSRVGRSVPGLVVTVYSASKSRDRSHYEQFVPYHQAFYRFVEATSITPFSPPARERGLHGLIIALARLVCGVKSPNEISDKRHLVEDELRKLLERIRDIDPDEEIDAAAEIDAALDEWEALLPDEYGKMGGTVNTSTLAYPFGSTPHVTHQREAWPVLTSMRNVDGTSEARVISTYRANDPTAEEGERA